MKAVTYALNVNSIYDYENALHIFESVSWKDRISDIERQKNKNNKKLSVGAGLLLYHALKNLGVTDYTIEKNHFGKPYLANEEVSYNLSHSGDYAVCTVLKGKCETGVDVEHIRKIKPEVIKKCFSEKEIGNIQYELGPDIDEDELYTRLWTLKESFLKMKGTGITVPLKEIDVSDPGAFFHTYSLPGYCISVCTNCRIYSEFMPITLDKL